MPYEHSDLYTLNSAWKSTEIFVKCPYKLINRSNMAVTEHIFDMITIMSYHWYARGLARQEAKGTQLMCRQALSHCSDGPSISTKLWHC
jgi:hypothetical protein